MRTVYRKLVARLFVAQESPSPFECGTVRHRFLGLLAASYFFAGWARRALRAGVEETLSYIAFPREH